MPAPLTPAPPVTQGHLLGGRVHYAQPATGFRSGIEPVLLAAAIPAVAGARVLEGGSGAGAALLCLAARVPGVAGLGIERDGALAALAADNLAANGFGALAVRAADLLADGWQAGPAADAPEAGFDHAFANPPYHPASGTASSDAARDAAKRGRPGLLAAWCAALAAPLRRGGTLTLAVPAAVCAEALAALAGAGCGGLTLFPLWPRAGRPAKLLLLRGRAGSRAPDRIAAGLILHGPDGYTPEATAVLRDGAALDVER